VIVLQHLWLLLQLDAAGTIPAVADSQSLSPAAITCKGQTVTRIEIHARPPFEVAGSNLMKRALRLATDLHVTTRQGVIRRFLALQVGDKCTELRRAESERILRAQPFLADADVVALSDGSGGVVLDVSTVDEVSLIVGGGLSAHSPHLQSARLGEANLMGTATYVVGGWTHGRNFRDAISGKITDYQFMGRPYQLAVWGGRRELGGYWATEASHPFLTDLQRLSWRTTAGRDDGYYYFLRPNSDAAAVKLNRSYGDIGGVIRIGSPGGSVGLLGGSISHEVENPGQQGLIVRDASIVKDPSGVLNNRFSDKQSTRLNALWGVRKINFVRVRGFDALDGTQDLRTGVEFATLLGKGIRGLSGQDDDLFTSAEIYAGAGSQRSYLALDLSAEGRRATNSEWDGVLAHGRGAFYLKPSAHHTIVSDLTWSAGWRQRVPFQVTFADRQGGLRGFASSDVGGARRMIARLEDRHLVGKVGHVASAGFAGFLDAGKIWAGDVPFGFTSPLSVSAGVSILGAVPPQSRRMWRVDLAFPIRGRTQNHGKWEIRFTNHDFTRLFRTEPSDVYSSRERSVPSSVFNWP
jgi:hypothetical protein